MWNTQTTKFDGQRLLVQSLKQSGTKVLVDSDRRPDDPLGQGVIDC